MHAPVRCFCLGASELLWRLARLLRSCLSRLSPSQTFTSRVRFCTSSDIYLLGRIVQLIIAPFVVPHRPKDSGAGGRRYPISSVGAARSSLHQRAVFIQYGPHQSPTSFPSPRCVSVRPLGFSLDFYKDASLHVMSIKAYSKKRRRRRRRKGRKVSTWLASSLLREFVTIHHLPTRAFARLQLGAG